jgi:hypothetical protein
MISDLLDNFVHLVAPSKNDITGTRQYSSVRWWIIVLVCIPMVLTTDPTVPLQRRATVLLLLNIFIRLLYPSCYYPATASISGWIASPVTARLVAFVAEFALYEVWAVWSGIDFWGNDYYVWLMVLVGEVVSTTGLFLQSEFLFFLEDTTWAIHASYMCFLSYPQWFKMTFYGGFAFHMWVAHLPRRFRLLLSRGRSTSKASSIFFMWPLFLTLNPKKAPNKVIIRECEFEEKAWVVPMLFGQAILTTIMYLWINTGFESWINK